MAEYMRQFILAAFSGLLLISFTEVNEAIAYQAKTQDGCTVEVGSSSKIDARAAIIWDGDCLNGW